MNILITCAGRRNYLVDYFKEAVHPLGGKVHVFNTDTDSAAYLQADVGALSPFANDSDYAAFVENYCTTHAINAVLSCMDVDLSILADLKDKFAALGITVIIADPWVTDMALDKLKTHQFLVEHNLNVTPLFTDLNPDGGWAPSVCLKPKMKKIFSFISKKQSISSLAPMTAIGWSVKMEHL